MSPTIVIDMGCTAPAPSPCTARKAMSAGMLHANPHRIDPTRNSPIPMRMMGLRPNRSESFA
jgi:hypothetical protein